MAKKVELTTGEVALVDCEDFSMVSNHNWYRQRTDSKRKYLYAQTGVDGSVILMHRLILGFPEKDVDHKNGDGLDNRRQNLRLCTHSENLCNQSSTPESSSQFKGVYSSKRGRWRVELNYQGERYRLGVFDSEREAALAYDRKALEVHGDFANTNILGGSVLDAADSSGYE